MGQATSSVGWRGASPRLVTPNPAALAEATETPEAAHEARKTEGSDYAALHHMRAAAPSRPTTRSFVAGKNEPRSHR